MSIKFISGKPGAGKSLYSTSMVLNVLINTRKEIVTNLALNVPRICEYLHSEHDQTFNAAERITILDTQQTAQFWLYHGKGLSLDPQKRITIRLASGKEIRHLDFQKRFDYAKACGQPSGAWQADGGCVYFIDEAHEFFNARNWADIGPDALHYGSQHRKLGDDVYLITQFVGNVDKQFRSIAQDFTYVRNHKKENLPLLGGLFRSVPFFTRSTYMEPFTGLQLSHETRTFRLDVSGIASCYDTAAGVGVQGAGADIGEKKKGLSPAWILGFAACVVAALWFAPNVVGKIANKGPADRKAEAAKASKQTFSANSAVIPAARGSSANTAPVQAAFLPAPVPVAVSPEVFLTGISRIPGGKWIAYVNDGRVIAGVQIQGILYNAFDQAAGVMVGGKRLLLGTPQQITEMSRLEKLNKDISSQH